MLDIVIDHRAAVIRSRAVCGGVGPGGDGGGGGLVACAAAGWTVAAAARVGDRC